MTTRRSRTDPAPLALAKPAKGGIPLRDQSLEELRRCTLGRLRSERGRQARHLSPFKKTFSPPHPDASTYRCSCVCVDHFASLIIGPVPERKIKVSAKLLTSYSHLIHTGVEWTEDTGARARFYSISVKNPSGNRGTLAFVAWNKNVTFNPCFSPANAGCRHHLAGSFRIALFIR